MSDVEGRRSALPLGALVVALVVLVVALASQGGRGADLPAPTFVSGDADRLPPDYRSQVLRDRPLAYWRLGRPGGGATDAAAGGHDGVATGAQPIGGALIGDRDRALSFGGSGEVRVPDPGGGTLDFGARDLTIEGWLRSTAAGGEAVLGKQGTSGAFWSVIIAASPGNAGTLRATFSDGRVARQFWSPRPVNDGEWHHFAVIFERKRGASVVVDGVWSRRAAVLAGSIDNDAPVRMGRLPGFAPLHGDLDEIAIYDRALPPERIAAHHREATRAELTMPEPTLTAPATSVDDATPRFQGVAGRARGDAARVTLEIFEGGEAAGRPLQTSSVVPSADGRWTFEDGRALSPGVHTARVSQLDSSGNIGRSAARTFTIEPVRSVDPSSRVMLAVGDIGSCAATGDDATAALLDRHQGVIQTLGDNAYPDGSTAAFQCFDASWGRHRARIRPALGDHEFDLGNADPYFRYFGARAGDPAKGYYSYDIGSWHVVVLNPNCSLVPGGCDRGSPQEAWLRADLAANPSFCTIGVLGAPRFSSGVIHGPQTGVVALWDALYAAGADIVLSADDHLYERFAPQTPAGRSDPARGMREFIVGTGGYSLYPFGPTQALSEARSNRGYGLLRLTLNRSGYEWRYLPVRGNSFTDLGSSPCT